MPQLKLVTGAVCPVRDLAVEAAALIVERRGIEDADPPRFTAIDARLEAIQVEAGSSPAVTREGLLLQACLVYGADSPGWRQDVTRRMIATLASPALEPLLDYYVGPMP